MTRPTLIALLLGAISPLGQASDGDPGAKGPPAGGNAARAAKAHLRSFLERDFKKMKTNYAARVKLMPGSEMLKPEYGLGGENGRATGIVVDRARLLAAMDKAFAHRPVLPADEIDKIFREFSFEDLEIGPGKYSTNPADPVGTPDGKLHFEIKKGDLLCKVGPRKGDFLLFQFRQIDGRWQVVAEYLD